MKSLKVFNCSAFVSDNWKQNKHFCVFCLPGNQVGGALKNTKTSQDGVTSKTSFWIAWRILDDSETWLRWFWESIPDKAPQVQGILRCQTPEMAQPKCTQSNSQGSNYPQKATQQTSEQTGFTHNQGGTKISSTSFTLTKTYFTSCSYLSSVHLCIGIQENSN